MQGTKNVLSKLKIRAGYGVTGQQEITDYMYLTTYHSAPAQYTYLARSY